MEFDPRDDSKEPFANVNYGWVLHDVDDEPAKRLVDPKCIVINGEKGQFPGRFLYLLIMPQRKSKLRIKANFHHRKIIPLWNPKEFNTAEARHNLQLGARKKIKNGLWVWPEKEEIKKAK